MFLWPFVVTGTFFLTLLNPPYTGMLLLRSISRSHSLLLGSSSPACLDVSDTPFLVQSPWLPLSHRHYPLALPAPHRSNSTTAVVVSSEVFLPAASRPLAASLPWSWSYSLPRQHDIITWILSCGKSLSLALYALILCVACWIVNRFRVPQPGSPALVFVDSLHKEIGQAFTPTVSFDSLSSGSSSDNSDEESDIIPGRWGLAILDGRIIFTKPALDSVPAVPMCLSPPDPSQSNDVDLLQASLLISKIKAASSVDPGDTRTTRIPTDSDAPRHPLSRLETQEEACSPASLSKPSAALSDAAQTPHKPRLPMVLLLRYNQVHSTRSKTRT